MGVPIDVALVKLGRVENIAVLDSDDATFRAKLAERYQIVELTGSVRPSPGWGYDGVNWIAPLPLDPLLTSVGDRVAELLNADSEYTKLNAVTRATVARVCERIFGRYV